MNRAAALPTGPPVRASVRARCGRRGVRSSLVMVNAISVLNWNVFVPRVGDSRLWPDSLNLMLLLMGEYSWCYT